MTIDATMVLVTLTGSLNIFIGGQNWLRYCLPFSYD